MAVISYPMNLWFYYQYPLYAGVLNLFVVPLFGFLMVAGLLVIGLQILIPELVFVPALLIRGILRIYEFSCNGCEKLPGHMLTLGKPMTFQLCIYLGIILLLIVINKQRKKKLSLKIKWFAVLAGILVLSLRFRNSSEVTFLDVGQGDCIYVQNRQGNHYLIDGGSTSVSRVGKYRIFPFLKYKGAGEIEAVIVTHPDEDHISGILDLLAYGREEGIKVKTLGLPKIESMLQDAAYKELENIAQRNGTEVFYLQAGDVLADGEMYFTCLNPKEDIFYREANEYSVVLEMREQDFSILFTGDAEGIGEAVLLEEYRQEDSKQRITVLKAAHHGSKYSTSVEMLTTINPEITVISCGKNNIYGHPHKETLERLERIGSRIFTTAQYGAITIRKDKRTEVYSWCTP